MQLSCCVGNIPVLVNHEPMIAISYRREDSLPIAGRLYDRLQAKFGKNNVFMDFDSIPPGTDFREQIKQMIERSNLVIAIIGPHWFGERPDASRRIDNPADFVRLEITYALEGGIPVIPVLVNNTPMPSPEKLPKEIEGLAFRNAVTLDTGIDFHHHADRLIAGIGKATGWAAAATTTQPAAKTGTEDVTKSHFDTDEQLKNAQVKEQRLKIAIVAAVIILAVMGGSVGWYFGLYKPASARKAGEERAATLRRESEAKAQQQRREASELVTAGQLLLKAGKLDEALARAREALAKVASYPDAKALVNSVAEARKKAMAAQATKEQPYENSLGMKFVAVPETGVLFSIWETRVKDFAAFVEGSGHQATGGMGSLGKEGWKHTGKTWKDPGFEQTGEHPVCGVSWEDATAFCEWLTKEERKSGRISTEQTYRLPSDLEWSAAVGLEKESGSTPEQRRAKVSDAEVYPWGSNWPPPSGAGNYAGSEARTGSWPPNWETIKGYRDNYPRTSPVGSFEANKYGIYDLGGNVWEWCQDWWEEQHYNRVIRGASWKNYDPVRTLSKYRAVFASWVRADDTGFRCVLAVVSSR